MDRWQTSENQEPVREALAAFKAQGGRVKISWSVEKKGEWSSKYYTKTASGIIKNIGQTYVTLWDYVGPVGPRFLREYYPTYKTRIKIDKIRGILTEGSR